MAVNAKKEEKINIKMSKCEFVYNDNADLYFRKMYKIVVCCAVAEMKTNSPRREQILSNEKRFFCFGWLQNSSVFLGENFMKIFLEMN